MAPNETIALYLAGKSIPDLARTTGRAPSTIRYELKKAGVLRTRADGVRMARPKLGSGRRGKLFPHTTERKQAISRGKLAGADRWAIGTSIKPSGYVEYTRGEHKGRSVHVVSMEERIGRRLLADEVVHHIDSDRANNSIDNLALMTRAAHARLHRREQRICGKAS